MTSTGAEDHTQGPGPGQTRIERRALERLALAVARDATGTPTNAIAVAFADEQGALRATLTLPVTIDRSGGTLAERGEHLRTTFLERFGSLSGRSVHTVDIRFDGIRRAQTGRVQ